MQNIPDTSHEDISISLPIKLGFEALSNLIQESLKDQVISKTNSQGKEIKYFRILNLEVKPSDVEGYNIELLVNLETLTTFYRNKNLQVSFYTLLQLDVTSQKVFVDNFKMDSKGQGWIADHLLKSILNTFAHQKILQILNIELEPLLDKQRVELNEKMAGRLEIRSGIFILGTLKHITVTHFEIKNDTIWIIIHVTGWGIIDIDHLSF